jgi:fucose permease
LVKFYKGFIKFINNNNVQLTITCAGEDRSGQFQGEQYRWVTIILYFVLSILIGVLTVVLTLISIKIVEIYSIKDFTINAVAMVTLLLFAIVSIPANYFIDEYGLRIGVFYM